MQQELEIREGAEEFTLGSGPVGALLIHGFTGSPKSMRGLGEHLAEKGLSVRGIRLPGHGTSWEELNLKNADDWVQALDTEFLDFSAEHEEVFLVGLSFGAALAIDCAVRRPDQVAGVVAIAPFLFTKDPLRFAAPVVGKVLKSFPGVGNDICEPGQDELCYDRLPVRAVPHMLRFAARAKRLLPSLRVPILTMHSRNDHTAPPEASQVIVDQAGSTDKEVVWFERSYHVITMDHDRHEVFERTYDFITKRVKHGD
ncbi:MAG: alpha/beta fold hydrolase [Actinomycetota bacterium]|nr:alpha/beta fold hydrolase [Actinomycetota bacterium]